MSFNLNKGNADETAPENKNKTTSNQSGVDPAKINFNKSLAKDQSSSTSDSGKPGVDVSKIDFGKPSVKKNATSSEETSSGVDPSKINFGKQPLTPVSPVSGSEKMEGASKVEEIKKNPKDPESVNKNRSGGNTWIGFLLIALIGAGIWYFSGIGINQRSPSDESASSNGGLINAENMQNESGISSVGSTASTDNTNESASPSDSSSANLGSSTIDVAVSQAKVKTESVAGGKENISNQSQSDAANNTGQSIADMGSTDSYSESNVSSARNKNGAVKTDSKAQIVRQKSDSKKSSKADVNTPLGDKIVAQFGAGSAEALKVNEGLLQQIISRMNSENSIRLLVVGYASGDGPSELNMRLSQERADRFRDILVERGVSQERITSVGRGIDNPIGDNSTSEGRRVNRRVELEFK